MFLKSLTLSRKGGEILRDIKFHAGINLIVDETVSLDGTETGNNVGKTTVLKLIDFCLGADAKGIYTDPENKRDEYKLVKEFLVANELLVTLILKDDLGVESSREVVIQRSFTPKKQKAQKIDGRELTQDEFTESLTELLFPGHFGKKPTFRQIIAHNIRYSEQSITHTIKHLDQYTRDDEYETLYLFLLGCPFDQGDLKQNLRSQIDLEEKFKRRLELDQTKSAYEAALVLLETEITQVEVRKSSLNLNPNFEIVLKQLNEIRYQINRTSSEISRLELRRNLVSESLADLRAEVTTANFGQLRLIYEQATSLISGIQKTFEEMCVFHNQMIESKRKFISAELPGIDALLAEQQGLLARQLSEEADLGATIAKSDTFDDLERLVAELNEKYRLKGEYENTIKQLSTIEARLDDLNSQMSKIDTELFSESFSRVVKDQANKFNRHFSSVSQELYGEKYALKADKVTKKGRLIYEFTTFNANMSSGKKQGEISCFDIAYTLFADDESIPCMHFLLNDKKELMHDNQLLKIAKLVNAKGIQFVASMLRDKLPAELNRDEYIILRLSQKDKLFRIEG